MAHHRLENSWCLWYVSAHTSPTVAWSERLKEVSGFETVEEFWGLFHCLVPPTVLRCPAEIYLFKGSSYPSYEAHPQGGIWSVSFSRRDDDRERLEEAWLSLVLGMIGETLDDKGDIVGCVVSVKRSHVRLSLWTATAHQTELQQMIGHRLRLVLNLPESFELQYRPNLETSTSTHHRLSQTAKSLTA